MFYLEREMRAARFRGIQARTNSAIAHNEKLQLKSVIILYKEAKPHQLEPFQVLQASYTSANVISQLSDAVCNSRVVHVYESNTNESLHSTPTKQSTYSSPSRSSERKR
jgi:hypothetical protein